MLAAGGGDGRAGARRQLGDGAVAARYPFENLDRADRLAGAVAVGQRFGLFAGQRLGALRRRFAGYGHHAYLVDAVAQSRVGGAPGPVHPDVDRLAAQAFDTLPALDDALRRIQQLQPPGNVVRLLDERIAEFQRKASALLGARGVIGRMQRRSNSRWSASDAKPVLRPSARGSGSNFRV